MEDKVEEYRKQFQPETIELIVKIRSCWEKGCPDFGMLGNYYKADATIDRALDVKSGELLYGGMWCYITWLCPEKNRGFKYVHKFKKGKMYRVLVREYIPKENENIRKFYLEQVLEKNIKEPRLDELYIFENHFDEKVIDLAVLIKKQLLGRNMESKYKLIKAPFIAAIENESNEFSRTQGSLIWMQNKRKLFKKFHLDEMGAYLVKVRKCKDNNTLYEYKDSYLLLDIIKKVTDDRFEKIKEDYLKPVVIKKKFGEFKLDRNINLFLGEMDYLDEKCSVVMYVEEGDTTAEIQINKLNEIVRDLSNWNNDIKKYALQELFEDSSEWCEEGIEITEEQFIQGIEVEEIQIDQRGALIVCLTCGDMLAGHGIAIKIDENGNFGEAEIG